MQISRLVLIIVTTIIPSKAEERLSWFSEDKGVKRSIFVPDGLSEGKEEDRTLPWVFHMKEEKVFELKCIMRGYNVSNSPSGYKDARWSHPGFDDSQVDTNAAPKYGNETGDGENYAIWTMKITVSAKDAGKKVATCDFQQGDFPLSIDIKFLIIRKQEKNEREGTKLIWSYDLNGPPDENDLTQQIEEDIKRQISEYYQMTPSDVTRSKNGWVIMVDDIATGSASTVTSIIIVISVLLAGAVILGVIKFKDRIYSLVCESDEGSS